MAKAFGGKRPQNLRHTLRRFGDYLGHHKRKLALIGVLTSISALAALIGTYMIRPAVNGILENGSLAYLAGVVAFTAFVYLIGALSTLGYTQLMVRTAQRITQEIRSDLFAHLQTMPLNFFDTNRKGDLMSLFTNDVDTISDALNNSFAVVIQMFIQIAGTLFLLLTGGEPLLYPAFRAVYLAVRKRGMIVTVNTNGTLLNEDWAAFFAKNPPRRVNVTLYGASGETYKSLCGDETGYAKAMRGIRLLQAHGVPVKVGVSVVRQNRHDLETLFQITKERNLELEPDTYMMSTESGQHEARLSPEEAAAASLAATRIKLGTVSFHEYAQRTVQALESAVPETEAGMRCLAWRCSFAVGWRGDLRPCVMLGALSVPIEHNDVQAAWRAVREKSAALKQNEACVVCKLRPLCRACPASSLREGGAFGTVPSYVCAYTKALYRLLCAESTAPEILKKGETVPHAQAL